MTRLPSTLSVIAPLIAGAVAAAPAPAEATSPLAAPPAPVARWVFDAASVVASTVRPAAGAWPGHLRGRPEIVDDEMGQSLILDGLLEEVHVLDDIGAVAAARPAAALTITAWVAVAAPQRWGGIVGTIQDNGDAETGWLLGFEDDRFSFALASRGADDGDGLITYMPGTTRFQPGRWYHVAATYDGALMRLYVNGREEAASDTQHGAILYPERAPLVIGAYRDDNEHYRMQGRIRAVAIYDEALPAESVRDDYARSARLAALPPYVDTRFRWVVRPYLQRVSTDGITVMWETSRRGTSAVVQATSLPLPPAAATTGGDGEIHEVRLSGLRPQTQYFYRVSSTDDLGQRLESDILTFQTAVEEGTPFAFVVVGDTQSGPEVVARVAEQAWAARPNFVLHAGDLVSTGGDKSHWTAHFFPNMAPLIGRVAFFPVLGNHEQNAGWYYDYMSLPAPEYYYGFRFGNLQAFMIDANKPLDPDSEQYRWLDDALASADATWRVVVHHQPAYTSDSDDYGDTLKQGVSTQGDPNVRHLVGLYERHGVDLVFNGHIHLYERTWPIRGNRVVEEGGVIYVTTGGGGGGLEQFAPARTWFSNTMRRGHHHCVVAVNGGTLQFRAVDLQGQVFDTFELRKRTP